MCWGSLTYGSICDRIHEFALKPTDILIYSLENEGWAEVKVYNALLALMPSAVAALFFAHLLISNLHITQYE